MKSRAERLTGLERDIARLERHLNVLQATSTRLMHLRMLAFGVSLLAGLLGLALGPGLGLGNWLGLLAFCLMLIPFKACPVLDDKCFKCPIFTIE